MFNTLTPMASSFSQIDIHLVFAVKYRHSLIQAEHREELHKYISGIVNTFDCKVIAIYAMPDHLHLFVRMHPKIAISDLVRNIKSNSSVFIKEKGWAPGFAWQEGFGAFAHSFSQRGQVIAYINHQEEHHRKKSFREEYIEFLRVNEIEYDERYIFLDPQ